MDFSTEVYVPWVGIIIGTVLSAIAVSIAAYMVRGNSSLRDRTYAEMCGPYVTAVVFMVIAMGSAVGINMYAWNTEGGGEVGTLRSEVSRVYDLPLTVQEAEALKNGETLLVSPEEGEPVVVRLEGDVLVTVGDWVPLER